MSHLLYEGDSEGIYLEGQTYPAWPREKDPDDIMDYSINWSPDLENDSDTIATSTWIVPVAAGLTEVSDSASSLVATIWLSGGTVGKWEIINRITTVGGRTYDKTRVLVVAEQ